MTLCRRGWGGGGVAGVDRYSPSTTPACIRRPSQQSATRVKGHYTARHTDGQHLCWEKKKNPKLDRSSPGGLGGWSPPVDLNIINKTTLTQMGDVHIN